MRRGVPEIRVFVMDVAAAGLADTDRMSTLCGLS